MYISSQFYSSEFYLFFLLPLILLWVGATDWYQAARPDTDILSFFFFFLISIVNVYRSLWMDNCFTKKETDNRESRSEGSSAGRTTLGDTRQGSRNCGLTFQTGRRAPAFVTSARSFCMWHFFSLIKKNHNCWVHFVFLSWGWLSLERMVSKTKWQKWYYACDHWNSVRGHNAKLKTVFCHQFFFNSD